MWKALRARSPGARPRASGPEDHIANPAPEEEIAPSRAAAAASHGLGVRPSAAQKGAILALAPMLRKPEKNAPLPAFDADDDESASTGEYRPLSHPLPSFSSSDELPRFPSQIDPRELGREPLPRPRAPASRRDGPVIQELDVAATLEKKPMTARAANRILAQLDRAPVRPDATGEIDLEDVLEEVYAEPPPRSSAVARSEPPPPPRSVPAPPLSSHASVLTSAPPLPPSVASFAAAPRSVPPPPPSAIGVPPRNAPALPGSSTVPLAHPAPPSHPGSYPGEALLPGSSTVPLSSAAFVATSSPQVAPVPPPYVVPAAPSSGYAVAPQHSAVAYAHTVPAGYVLVPEGSLVTRDHALPLSVDAALVRPLPVADEPKRGTSLLGKVLAGGILLGLSALAGGAASVYLLPDPPAAAPTVSAPAVSASPSAGLSSIAPATAPASAPSATSAPSILAPIGTGWPLAPATVPPGAASMAPPPPGSVPAEGAQAPAASAPNPPAPSASASAAISPTMGRIVFGPARAGHRVWVDGAMVGESVAPILVKCGKRHVRIGSSSAGQTVDVPCGGEIVVK